MKLVGGGRRRSSSAWIEVALLWAIVALGFVLRIARVPGVAFSADEAQFIHLSAADGLVELWQLVTAKSPHPPANFVGLYWLMKVSWNPLWLRLPAILAGSFSIWLAHRFGRALLGPVAGLALAGLVAFSPAMLHLSTVCRNYAPGFAFLLASVHLLVRHLQTGSRRPLVAFAAVAAITAVWHYSFVVVFVALAIVVALELALQRRPARAWLDLALAFLPYAVVSGALYVFHIRGLPQTLVSIHSDVFVPGWSLGGPFAPFLELWRYLETSPFAELFALAALVAVPCLLVQRERLALLVCIVPLLVAYGFSRAGLVPLGGSRHSAHLFPFLFALVAAQAQELASGYQRTRNGLSRWSSRAGVEQPAAGATRRTAAVLGVVGVWFAVAAVRDISGERTFDFRRSTEAQYELPVWLRADDLDRAFEILERRVGPEDLVVLQPQAAWSFLVHHRIPPEPDVGDPAMRQPPEPIVRRGVAYHLPGGGLVATLPELVDAVVRVLEANPALRPARVWTLHGSWEAPLARQLRLQYPQVPFDEEVDRESQGLVFAIDWRDLRRVRGLQPAARSTRGVAP